MHKTYIVMGAYTTSKSGQINTMKLPCLYVNFTLRSYKITLTLFRVTFNFALDYQYSGIGN